MIKQLLIFLATFLISQTLFAQYQTLITVAKDDSADYESIQEAINATKAFPDREITIKISNGVYHEKVRVYSWNTNLSIIGESKDSTIIVYDDYFDKIGLGRNSTFHTYTMKVEANDFRAQNLTIRNAAGPVGQAVALHVEGDRVVFENCNIQGDQDTIYAAGENLRQYFKNCFIEGTTDFIFGGATALFQDCTIHSKSNSYITAASTPSAVDFGFVFLNCKLTAEPDVSSVYLGRPWRPYAKTAFINCELGEHIRPEGWHNWGDTAKENSVFYAEYGSVGAGAEKANRVKWVNGLSDKQAQQYSVDKIFRDWNPKI